MNKRNTIKTLTIAAMIIIFVIVVTVTAITGFKTLFRKYYVRPVPINPFLSYGQKIDDNGEVHIFVPCDDQEYEVISP